MFIGDFFVYLATAWGLGAFLNRAFRLGLRDGLTWAVGFFLIPFCLFSIHLLGGVGLRASSRLTFGVALVALAFDIALRLRSSSWDWKNHGRVVFRRWSSDPAVWFMLIVGLGATLGFRYRPREWDEFSHWLLMPRQMAAADGFLSEQFLFDWLATYTPGWPAATLYPQVLLRGQFNEQGAWLAPIVSASLFLVAFSSVVRVETQSRMAVWGLTGATLLLPWGASFFKPTLLIENPGMHIFGLTFLVMYEAASGRLRFRSAAVVLGILAGVAYLLKKPFVVLLPGSAWFLFLIRERNAEPSPLKAISPASKPDLDGRLFVDSTTEGKKCRNIPNFFVSAMICILPLLFIYFLWRSATRDFVELWSVDGAPGAKNWTPDRWWAAPRMFWNLIKYEPSLILSFVASFYIGKRDEIVRNVSRTALLIFAVYFVGLGYLYVFSFGAYEGPRLVSFRRYVELVALPIQAWIWLAILVRAHYVPLLERCWQSISKKQATLLVRVISLLGFAVCAKSAFGMMLNSYEDHDLNAAEKFVVRLSAAAHPGTAVLQIPPRILMIAQEDDGRAMARLRYALVATQGIWAEGKRPQIEGDWSFAATSTNVWTRAMSDENFADLLRRVDYVWVLRSNSWLNEQLLPLVDLESCQDFGDKVAETNRSDFLVDGLILSRSQKDGNRFLECRR